MRCYCSAAVVLTALLLPVSCNRDPNVAKRRYLESGNRYFERGKYKEAAIMYKDALQKDMLWGPAHYKLALTQLKLNQLPAAVSEFRKAVERLPKDSPDHWDAAIKLCDIYLAAQTDPQKKSLEELRNEADGFIKELLARDPNSFDGHRLNGDAIFIQARFAAMMAHKEQSDALLAQAMAEYRKADSIKPGQDGVMMQISRVEAGQGDFDNAEKTMRQVVAQHKTNEGAYLELYRLQLAQGKKKDGEQTLREGFQNNPKTYRFLVFLAQQYFSEQRRPDMLKVLEEIKSYGKDFPAAYVIAGDFYLQIGDGDGAIREYREGIAKVPSQKIDLEKHIVQVLMMQNKRGEAAALNSSILKEKPDDTDAKGLEGTLLLDKGDVNRAVGDLESVVNRAPSNPVAHFNLAKAYLAKRQAPAAEQQLEKSLEIRPDFTQARMELAQLQILRGEFDAGFKNAGLILERDKDNAQAQLIQSAALIGQKKYGDAGEILNRLQKAHADSPDVMYQVGLLNLSQNKFKEAEAAFRRTFELNPANLRGLLGVVEALMTQNKPDAALAVLQTESAKQPARADLKLAMGTVAVRAGRFDQAIQIYQGMVNSGDAKQRGEIYVRIGECYRLKGDLQNAIIALQKARELMPDNVVALGSLGLVLDSANRWSEARQVYDAALKLQPDNAVTLNNNAFLIAEHGGDLDQALTMVQRATQLQPNLAEIRAS